MVFCNGWFAKPSPWHGFLQVAWECMHGSQSLLANQTTVQEKEEETRHADDCSTSGDEMNECSVHVEHPAKCEVSKEVAVAAGILLAVAFKRRQLAMGVGLMFCRSYTCCCCANVRSSYQEPRPGKSKSEC